MDPLTIDLPQPAREFVDRQVATGAYPSAAEYIAALIEADRARQAGGASACDDLEKAVDEGIADLDNGRFTDYDTANQLAADITAEGTRRLGYPTGIP